MALKLPRTIRLDPSDTLVYARAAEPGEWAVSGTFMFFGADVAAFSGKQRQAFRAGFLGIGSFGWSTLVVVTEASPEDRAAAVERLAQQLVVHCGAPDAETARQAAEEEIAFAQSLCDHPPNTLIGIHRTLEDNSIRDSFRTLHRRPDRLDPISAYRFIAIDEEDEEHDEIDLVTLVRDDK